MELAVYPSLVALFFARAAEHAEQPFLFAKRDGNWSGIPWSAVADDVSALAAVLIARGIVPGDRIALISENRPEWLIADLAIMAAGAVTVPVYTTNTVEDHLHILSNSGAKAAIYSTAALGERVLPAANRVGLSFAVAIETPTRFPQGVEVLDWAHLIGEGRAGAAEIRESLDAPWRRLMRGDLACLQYTSGTGGAPRGVMLSHGNILHNCHGAFKLLESILTTERERFLSFLPLSHSYEHTAGQFFPLSIGAEIFYAEGVEKLNANLVEVKPTIVTLVPRLYEATYQKILSGLTRQPKWRRKLFNAALQQGIKRYEKGGLSLPGLVFDPLLESLVRNKVRARFGGRVKALVSGGAALNTDIGLFFHALGLPVLQGYGQTEAAPVISCNVPLRAKLHTVGPPLDGVELRIAEDGEICVRGEMVMKGYWQDESATSEAIRDGWLHTGDIGRIDESGYLVITDRKRDVIVLSGGDNVSPARVEGLLTLEPEIAQAMVIGDKRPHLVAVLVPDDEFLKSYARASALTVDRAEFSRDPEFRKAMAEVINRVNKRLSTLERIKTFIIIPEPFTTENGQLTPSLKVRRHMVRAAYGDQIEAMYGQRTAEGR